LKGFVQRRFKLFVLDNPCPAKPVAIRGCRCTHYYCLLSIVVMSTTHFGFQSVDEREKAGRVRGVFD
jgi:hypothetical protein